MVSVKLSTLLEFRTILESDQVQDFDCGIDSLNEFLKNYAWVNQNRKLSSTVIALKQHTSQPIMGYYTLSPAQIEPEALPKKIARSLPKYPVPAYRLCRLAVAQKFQNSGFGKELLVHALMKCWQQSIAIGGYCVLVDAINEHAKSFYENMGFIPLSHDSKVMMLPMKFIEAYM